MARLHTDDGVITVDIEAGGDGEEAGVRQELTTDDIDEVACDAHLSVNERRRQLMGLLEEVRLRRSGDLLGDTEEVSSHLRDRIAALCDPSDGQPLAEAGGMARDDNPAEDEDSHELR